MKKELTTYGLHYFVILLAFLALISYSILHEWRASLWVIALLLAQSSALINIRKKDKIESLYLVLKAKEVKS